MSDFNRFVGVWDLVEIEEEDSSDMRRLPMQPPIDEKSPSRMSGVKGRRPLRGARSAPLTPDIRGVFDRPVGLLIYLETGVMSVNFAGSSRIPFLREFSPTASELAAAGAAYGGYAGRWEVDERRREVLHHVETAFVPNRVGRTIRRSYSFSENLLLLRPLALSPGEEAPNRVLRWRRRA